MPSCTCCQPGLRRRGLFSAALAGAALMALPARAADPTPPTSLTADQALARLLDGNRRFMAGEISAAAREPARRAALAAGQAPFAAILACADSRVAPELLFHAGLGEIFVMRNAGNIADNGAVGSLEYAVAVLGVPLVVVLGHERCGAAGAAVTMAQDETNLPLYLRDMLLPMLPSALAATRAGGDLLDGTVRRNVRRNVQHIAVDSPVIAAAVAAGKVKVVGAYYDLDEESVTVLG